MRLGNGELSVRPNNIACLCRVCGQSIVKDHVYGAFWGSQDTINFHRTCMKNWLEYSYDVMAPTPSEINMDPNGKVGRVEIGRMKREFESYRQELLARMTTDVQ